ncbi:hypothetical protein HBI26_251660 [Parastagonospora nodorum]|nr:hypothetical protein HBI11_221280 [Parastagonospora nodorum]KAH5464125.1 hypothetical protein HBI28_251970 [Parastagonospora nodorum]KAH5549257.1 hypothetical protein HBI26_251660 [Parastagonospora nodorum]KAH5617539.1 hypothetical protein HBI22_252620 [Parastagonospora nodorum]KAH5710859.1 hypothetical protein HBI18_222680 [Parastagonospora nodorum]
MAKQPCFTTKSFEFTINKDDINVLSTLRSRRLMSYDPSQLVPRGGWQKATVATYLNGDTADETTPKAIAFSISIFIRGFNLTLIDFKIVRRCLIICIVQIGLTNLDSLQSEEAQFWISEVASSMREHPLLQKDIPSLFKENLTRLFITKTAIWMRTELDKNKDAFTPGRSAFPTTSYGQSKFRLRGRALKLAPGPSKISVEKLVLIATLTDTKSDEEMGQAVIPPAYMQKSTQELEDMSEETRTRWNPFYILDYARFVAAIENEFQDTDLGEYEWAVGWYSAEWGNQVLEITDDISLWVAIYVKRARGDEPQMVSLIAMDYDDEEKE